MNNLTGRMHVTDYGKQMVKLLIKIFPSALPQRQPHAKAENAVNLRLDLSAQDRIAGGQRHLHHAFCLLIDSLQ